MLKQNLLSNVMNQLGFDYVHVVVSLLVMLLFTVICCPQLNLYNKYTSAEHVWVYIGY